ncbi:uncharacterized protein N7500_006214 [Penicillium coprophilum]|uniref:uncharacterized protein n=1 Tax=Penicillium coprophilum TaxID=36646 RepID=UPI0023A518C3|nr:uncharacterized protein N7500_006214 [Penicillium coprophilum]KAJ5164384.1 hypothetical protein N7500_006214 [Penicillium coprophilum]
MYALFTPNAEGPFPDMLQQPYYHAMIRSMILFNCDLWSLGILGIPNYIPWHLGPIIGCSKALSPTVWVPGEKNRL